MNRVTYNYKRIGIVIALFVLLLMSMFGASFVFNTRTAIIAIKECEKENFGYGIAAHSANYTRPSPCKACVSWDRWYNTKGHQLSHTDQLRQLYVETVALAVSGYVIQTPGRDFHGASITARAVIFATGSDKIVWVADSFQGLPKASMKRDDDGWAGMYYNRVPLDVVKSHFERFHLLDHEKVRFIKGFFNESMPVARKQHIRKLSLLRLDGDMYESCFDVINNMYDRLSIGGYVIIDDWEQFPCRWAIEDYRKELNITETIVTLTDAEATDGKPLAGAFWRKTTPVANYDVRVLHHKFIKSQSLNRNT